MALSDWADTQILAIGGAVSLIIGGAITAAKQSLKTTPVESVPSSPRATIFMDATQIKQAQNLSDQLGLLTTAAVRLSASLDRNNEHQDRAQRAWERNSEAADKVADEAAELRVRIQTLTAVLTANPPRR